jgi:UDP-perosamine 4-acetyltransferase
LSSRIFMAEAIAIIGAGGHARVVAEAILAGGLGLLGHVAPDADQTGFLGTHLGDDVALPHLVANGVPFAIGIGFVDAAGAARRAAILAQLSAWGARLITVVHPAAVFSPSAVLGEGSFLAAGAMLGTRSRLGIACIVNTGAIVDHDAQVGPNTHIATGATLAGGITLGRDVLIGVGAVLRQGVMVGDRAVVGAGSVVLRAIGADTTAVGNPAKERA